MTYAVGTEVVGRKPFRLHFGSKRFTSKDAAKKELARRLRNKPSGTYGRVDQVPMDKDGEEAAKKAKVVSEAVHLGAGTISWLPK